MLSIWMPCTKDIRNQGLVYSQPTGDYEVVNDSQRGKVVHTTSATDIDTLIKSTEGWDMSTGSCGFGAWLKFNLNEMKFASAYTYTSSVSGIRNVVLGYNSYGGFSFDFSSNNIYTSGEFTSASIQPHFRFGSVYVQTTGKNVVFDEWHHWYLQYVKERNSIEFYYDGVFFSSASTTPVTISTLAKNFKVNGNTVWGGNGAGKYLPYYVSDVRVYNHKLSADEIKGLASIKVFEINGGMYLEETTNLITGITKGGQTNIVNNEVLTTGTNADTYFTLNLSESIVVGTQYTISCYADLPSGTYWNFPLGTQSNTALTWSIVPGYNSYTFTANDINWGANRIFMDDLSGPARTSGQQCRFYRFQLEKKSHATPLSFGHRDNRIVDLTDFNYDITPYNLIKSGSSFYFNGVDSAIKIPMHEMISGGTWSINLWFYRPNGEFGTKTWETLVGGPSGFELEATSSSTKTLYVCPYSWGGGKFAYESDRWNMVTLTRTSSGSKLYINGSLVKSGSAGSTPSGDYFIGAWKTATQQNFKGYIKKFSVFKKCLSDDDVMSLYIHGK